MHIVVSSYNIYASHIILCIFRHNILYLNSSFQKRVAGIFISLCSIFIVSKMTEQPMHIYNVMIKTQQNLYTRQQQDMNTRRAYILLNKNINYLSFEQLHETISCWFCLSFCQMGWNKNVLNDDHYRHQMSNWQKIMAPNHADSCTNWRLQIQIER